VSRHHAMGAFSSVCVANGGQARLWSSCEVIKSADCHQPCSSSCACSCGLVEPWLADRQTLCTESVINTGIHPAIPPAAHTAALRI
jgi:hypothetical protein